MDWNGLAESAKIAADLVQAGKSLIKDFRELTKTGGKDGVPVEQVDEIVASLNEKLIGAQEAQMRLLNEIYEMKDHVTQMDRRAELERLYDPVTTGAGALVLAAKALDESHAPANYICPGCAEEGVRSFLQPQGRGRVCPRCETFFPFDPAPDISDFPEGFGGASSLF